MIITNKLGLPRAFVEMAQRDYTQDEKRYSVTALLKGTREAILEKRHGNEIEQDVSDMIWLLFGQAVHSILEQQEEEGHELKETKLTMPITVEGKSDIGEYAPVEYTLSGIFDLYNAKEKKITDYKTCSVWKVIYNDYTDWQKQLLIYAYMMRYTGFDVNCGEIVAIMKDHSKSKAKYDSNYPQYPVKVIRFDFTEQDFEDIESFLLDKFNEIHSCENLSDEELPLCSQEERYNSGDKFAVMKKRKKRALRVLDTKDDAEIWMNDNGGDYIETRPGEDKKCAEYCNVAPFCSHYKGITKEGE